MASASFNINSSTLCVPERRRRLCLVLPVLHASPSTGSRKRGATTVDRACRSLVARPGGQVAAGSVGEAEVTAGMVAADGGEQVSRLLAVVGSVWGPDRT